MAWQLDPSTCDLLHGCFGSGSFVSTDAYEAYAVFGALAYENPATGAAVMSFAKSITSNPTNDIWTITLKSNIKFSDGTPYDATAIQYNWLREQNPANTSQDISYVSNIKAMQVVSSLTLRVTLSTPDSQFDRVVASQLSFIGSPKAIQDEGAGFGNAPVGAGPFVLQSWVHGSQWVLVRNSNYYFAPLPYANKLVINIITSAQQRYNSLVTGASLLMGPAIDPTLVTEATGLGYKAIEVKQDVGGENMMLNQKSTPFNSILAREALAHAINYSALNSTVFGPLFPPVTRLISKPSPFYNSKLKLPGYDPKLAQKLLNDYYAQTGQPLTFTFSVSTNSQPEGEYLQAQLLSQYQHINPSVSVIANNAFGTVYAKSQFQVIVGGLIGYDPDPGWYQALDSNSATNFFGENDPALDKALETGIQSANPAVRKAAYDTAQRLWIKDIPGIMLYPNDAWLVFNTSVQNVKTSAGYPLWDQMWIKS